MSSAYSSGHGPWTPCRRVDADQLAAAAALALAWTIANVAADPDHRARPLAKSIAGELTSPSMAGVNVGDVSIPLPVRP